MLVLQSTIVLFIAAPPLVRAIYHLPAPGSWKRSRREAMGPATAGAGAASTTATQEA